MRNRQLHRGATCSVLTPPPIFFLSPCSLSQDSSLREWHHQGPAGAARRRSPILILGSRSESRGCRTHLLLQLGRRFGNATLAFESVLCNSSFPGFSGFWKMYTKFLQNSSTLVRARATFAARGVESEQFLSILVKNQFSSKN